MLFCNRTAKIPKKSMMLKWNFIYSCKSRCYLCFCGVVILLVGCEDEKMSARDTQVFRYNEYSNISSLDPAFARTQSNIWATHQLYNGLVQLDDSLNIRPDIAKRWEIGEDALTYQFYLRGDVAFHRHVLFGKDSTRSVRASDFEYSLNRLLDPDVAAPGKWVLNYVDRFYAENDTLFVIQLKQPFPAFLGLLTTKYCSVVPREVVEHYGSEFRRNPIGTGPFRFKMWEENIKLVLRRNPHYHEKDEEGKALPYLEAVAITFLPDKQSAFLQFVQGRGDLISGLDPSYKDELLTSDGELQEAYKDKVNLIKGPYLNTEYLAFYLESDTPEASSIKLRKAVNYGFDREKMIRYLRNGVGIPATRGFIPKGLPGYSETDYHPYDPEKAKILIDTYIEETGDADPSIVLTTDANYLDLCEYIQRELQKLGLDIAVEATPASTLRQGKATGKLDFFRASWIADYPDAENYLSLFYSLNFAPSGPNYSHFKDVGFDALYEEATLTNDLALRYTYYRQMDSLVMEQAPVVPLYYDEILRFTPKHVKGLGINPINLLTLKRVRKE